MSGQCIRLVPDASDTRRPFRRARGERECRRGSVGFRTEARERSTSVSRKTIKPEMVAIDEETIAVETASLKESVNVPRS